MFINRCKKEKGFTLIELVVTMMVLVILLTGTVAGISAYQKYAAYKRNDEYAQSLYIAAQSGLAHLKASGELEAFVNQVEKVSDAHGQVPSNIVTDDAMTVESNRLSYLWLQNGDQSTKEGSLIVDLLGDYVYDAQILDATISVELDANDGVIYSVCYSDRAKEFTYNPSQQNLDAGVISILDRTSSVRKDVILGYYGAELSERAPSSYGKAKLNKVELVNDDTLYLKWSMSNQYKSMVGAFQYKVKLFDEANTLRMEFTVNKDASRLTAEGKDASVTTDVLVYDKVNGSATTYPNVKFHAYVNPNYEVIFVLDAVDTSAVDAATLTNPENKLINTYSMKRFGFDNTLVYAKVQASGAKYGSGVYKQSNKEYTFFGDKINDTTYEIQNARHLFNIHFEPTAVLNYKQTKDIIWEGENGIVSNNHVFDAGNCVSNAENKAVFPSIEILPKGSTYASEDSLLHTVYTISGLHFDAYDEKEKNYALAQQSLGLFRLNAGSIKNIHFSDVTINGINPSTAEGLLEKDKAVDNVGTVCGVNQGNVENVIIESGTITGGSNVGGLIGVDQQQPDGTGEKITYQNLENGADVTGISDVGGIIGNAQYTKLITNCKNKGIVCGNNADRSAFIGGIAGYIVEADVKECESTPGDIASFMQATAADADWKENLLLGKYVGGIVGAQTGGKIEKCTTGGGFVYGNSYVGGIAGYIGDPSKPDESPAFILDGEESKARACVIGNSYVGGIIGYNEKNGKIINWKNKGLVTAVKEYAGGIVGYNEGFIQDCDCDSYLDGLSGDDLLQKVNEWGKEGNYVGGIAGYNNSKIDYTRGTGKVNSVVAGNNYVGGIIGYNDVNGTMSNYQVKGGYLSGHCFVGGITGLNASEKLYDESQRLLGSTNKIVGDYFIGGITGANIMPLTQDVTIQCSANNFLGSVEAKGAYAGGFIGFQYNMGVEGLPNQEMQMQQVRNLTNALTITVGERTDSISSAEVQKTVKNVNTLVENATGEYEKLSNKNNRFIITGKINSEEEGKIHFDLIQAQLYAGGAVAYNYSQSKLLIQNVVNYSLVKATSAVKDLTDEYEPLLKANLEGDKHKSYSYVGGMTGIVTENVTLRKCRNQDAGNIVTQGTYTGGLAEINLGTIEECDIQHLGSTTASYVGGIAGVNGNTGKILSCSFSGTVIGNDNVGGIVSDNFGAIGLMDGAGDTLYRINGTVYGVGVNVGGIAGYNHATAKIEKAFFQGHIEGNGTNVGAFVGSNGGILRNLSMKEHGVTVTGKDRVGGLVGAEVTGTETTVLSDLLNYAVVTAENGSAGGILGGIVSTDVEEESIIYTLKDSKNYGKVQSNSNGSAGGILAINGKCGRIENCINYAQVSAQTKGKSGGICGENRGDQTKRGIILSCRVEGTDSNRLELRGHEVSGGICAINAGLIENCNTKYVRVHNQGTSVASNIGGICGTNEKTGIIRYITMEKAEVLGYSTGSRIGGVAGYNYGEMDGKTSSSGEKSVITNIVIKSIGSGDDALSSYMGGIVGVNENTVKNYIFIGNIRGNGGEQYGYGGIAGANGTKDHHESAIEIADCKVGKPVSEEIETSVIKANGEASNIARVGGIVGVNYDKCKILRSYVYQTEISADYGFVGGIVGENNGFVQEVGVENGVAAKSVKIETNRGHIGGIIGFNNKSAFIADAMTGSQWQIKVFAHATDNATGGIIGYNLSANEMKNLRNYATVTKEVGGSNAVAGIIGRQEVSTTDTWRITNCHNHADIKGNERVGGIIGQVKYCGGTITNCTNSGNLTSKSSRVGGIIGQTYLLNKNTVLQLEYCKNLASVTANSGTDRTGGIIGFNEGGSPYSIRLTECVNAGNVKGGPGMIGNKGPSTITFIRCRNYGMTSEGSGFMTQASNMTDCFGISQNDKPISSYMNTKGERNFYFGPPRAIEQKYGIENCTVMSAKKYSYSNGSDVNSLVDGMDGLNQSTSADKNRMILQMQDSKWEDSLSMDFKVTQPDVLNSITIYWFNADTRNEERTYIYDLTLKDESNNVILMMQDRTITCAAAAKSTEEKITIAGNLEPMHIILSVKDVETENVTSHNIAKSPYVSIWEMKLNDQENSGFVTNDAAFCREKGYGNYMTVSQDGSTYQAVCNPYKVKDLPIDPLLSKYTDQSNNGANQIELYEKVDPYLILYYKNLYNAMILKDITPTDITLQDMGGEYQIKWKEQDMVYRTEIVLHLYDNLTGEETESRTYQVYNGNQITLPLENEWIGKYYTVSVQFFGADDSNYSKLGWYDNGNRNQIIPFLVTPEVHLEYVDETNSYQAVLDNADAYASEGTVTIEVTDGAKATLTVTDGVCTPTPVTQFTPSGEVIVTVQAKKADGSKSKTYSRQTQIMNSDYLKNTPTAAVADNGFRGDTLDTLEYHMTITSKSQEIYYRNELLVPDKELKEALRSDTDILTVTSASVMRVPGSSSGTKLEVTLNNIPETLTAEEVSKIRARSYPWYSQNEVVYYTMLKAENQSIDQVKTSEAINGTQIKEGYSLQKNEDGTYNIYYSKLLSKSGDSYSPYGQQVFESQVGTAITKTIDPVISPTIAKDENRKYTFSWDQTDTTVTGPYTYEIWGIGLDDVKVSLSSSNSYTDKKVELNGEEWRYKKLILQVTRIGTKDSQGKTRTYGIPVEKTYDVKAPLSKLAAPNLVNPDKDELLYTVTWLPETNSEELNVTDHYAVYVLDTSEEDNVPVKLAETLNANTCTAEIDLNEYQEKQIEVFVVAVAKADDPVYEDSLYGVRKSLTVPIRMKTPGSEVPAGQEWKELTPSYEEDSYITTEALQNDGIKLTIKGGTGSGYYTLKAAVYDSNEVDSNNKPTGKRLYALALEDEAGVSEEERNLAEVTMTEGEEGHGTLENSYYRFRNFNTSLAGKYLFFQVRAKENSEISSEWTEFQSIRLPRMKLETPSVSYQNGDSETITADIGTIDDPGTFTKKTEKIMTIRPKVLSWTSDTEANQYQLVLKYKTQDGTEYMKECTIQESYTVNGDTKEKTGVTISVGGTDMTIKETNGNDTKYEALICDMDFTGMYGNSASGVAVFEAGAPSTLSVSSNEADKPEEDTAEVEEQQEDDAANQSTSSVSSPKRIGMSRAPMTVDSGTEYYYKITLKAKLYATVTKTNGVITKIQYQLVLPNGTLIVAEGSEDTIETMQEVTIKALPENTEVYISSDSYQWEK